MSISIFKILLAVSLVHCLGRDVEGRRGRMAEARNAYKILVRMPGYFFVGIVIDGMLLKWAQEE
jgi:hypothetical protein